jgi:hypothetical protein
MGLPRADSTGSMEFADPPQLGNLRRTLSEPREPFISLSLPVSRSNSLSVEVSDNGLAPEQCEGADSTLMKVALEVADLNDGRDGDGDIDDLDVSLALSDGEDETDIQGAPPCPTGPPPLPPASDRPVSETPACTAEGRFHSALLPVSFPCAFACSFYHNLEKARSP